MSVFASSAQIGCDQTISMRGAMKFSVLPFVRYAVVVMDGFFDDWISVRAVGGRRMDVSFKVEGSLALGLLSITTPYVTVREYVCLSC